MRVLRISHSSVVAEWRQREDGLRSNGVDVTLVTATRWHEGGADVRYEARAGRDVATSALPTIGTHPNLFAYAPGPLFRLLREDWDLLDIAEEPFSLAALEITVLRVLARCRAPYVLISAQNIAKRYPPPFRWTERAILAGASGGYVCNDAAASLMRTRGLCGPVVNLGLGVDLAAFTPDARRSPPADLHRVGFVGRLDASKGIDVLLDAVEGAPGLTLDVAGSGELGDAVARRAAHGPAAGRVTVHGPLPHDALPDFYRTLDVLAVPSLPTPGWIEQFGRVAVEAMASGVPVVASASGALPEVVGDAGVVVEPGDAEALRRALTGMTGDPERWAELRRRGLERAGRYAWPAVAAAHARLYEAALHPKQMGHGTAPVHRPVTVLVVAFGAPDLLDACLDALGGRFDAVVVDNSSSAGTRAVAEHHGARYVDPGTNLGFAAGVNRGLEEVDLATTDVLLCNPDARVSPEAVQQLREALARHDGLACVAPVQHAPGSDASDRVTWPFPTPWGAWVEAVGLGRLRRSVGFLIGAVLLIDGRALIDVGGFDERFFLYDEETDWQRRARRRGWQVRLVPGADAVHQGAATDTDTDRREIRFHAGTERYIRKWFGAPGWWLYRAAVIAGTFPRMAFGSPPTRARARARLAVYLAGPDRAARRAGAVPPAVPAIPDLARRRP